MKDIKIDTLIVIGLLVVVVTAAVFLVYVPQHKRLWNIQAQIVSKKMALEASEEDVAIVPEMARQIEVMKKHSQGFDRSLPKRKELAAFLHEISSILASEELSNQLTKPGDPTEEEQFHILPIIMKFEGSYLALSSLLERIDNMERLARVKKMSISKKQRSEDLNIELEMNIYFKEG